MPSSRRKSPRPASTASRSWATGSRRWCARSTASRSSTIRDRATSTCGLPYRGAGRTRPNRTRSKPVTLFVGTEKGFTYRLTLTPRVRDSAQILIRNAEALPDAVSAVPAASGDAHVAALMRLVRAVARREPLPGYEIRAGEGLAHPGLAHSGLALIETWRGPRYAALVFEAARPASEGEDGAAGLAGTIEELPGVGRVAALWLASPGTGPAGGRLAVAVTETHPAGASR